ncbi:hypothetical protein CONCODRAFT_20945 [Conidiobolus coronatus NRRL 28638]|uniref:Transcription factor domain-containing protein n=1 Tax=Conidiobolus coronatus (strain ATCC 28846 / CBS 209.66 / NRRL 28638) TaxID=796925 RepID=A0A137NQF8_CONC2|nr:hypothetical protein CONCODRAFT_20945 [Conidiobolus coronatus NRRL 28638]|eukprot:KXN64981.1 hypothetical protein CONCODRAFT_20945 [Conidiobolus coronatus NRRL 28638]
MLEKDQFKFKYHQPKGKGKKLSSNSENANDSSNWSNTYYDVINGNEFSKGTSISKVNRRLDNIEGVLSKALPVINRALDRKECTKLINYKRKNRDDSSSEYSDDYETTIISHYSDIKTLNYEDYPKFMLSFYFTMQEYCSFPPVMDLREFFNCTKVNSNSAPDHLMSAIISHASLNSPHPVLHLQNVQYSDYYYKLSILQMTGLLATPNIYVIQTLLILCGIDEALHRPLQKFERVTTAVKLAQVMGMDKQDELVEGFLPDHFMGASKETVKKLWVLVKTIDWEMSKARSCPPLVQTDDDWILPTCKSYEDQALIRRCMTSLPKEYIQLFEACTQFAKLAIPAFSIMEQDQYSQSNLQKTKYCLNVLQKISNWQDNLPSSAKFTKDCLNPEKLANNPQLRLRLNLYQKMSEICLKIYQYGIYNSYGLELKEVLPLIQNCIAFGKRLVDLLETYQFSAFESNLSKISEFDDFKKSDKVGLSIDLFNMLGSIYLSLIQLLKTIKLSDFKEFKALTIVNNMIHSAINNLIQNMVQCTEVWTNSEFIVNELIERYKNLESLDYLGDINGQGLEESGFNFCKSGDGWNNSYCNVIDSREKLNQEGLDKLNKRLENIESLLNQYIPAVVKNLTNNSDKNGSILSQSFLGSDTPSVFSPNTEFNSNSSINGSEASAITAEFINSESIVKQLISIYFTIQSHCTYPPIIDLSEFHNALNSNTLPDCLVSAILSNACLNAPLQSLNSQNYYYSTYYYKLSLSQLNQSITQPTIYTIMALLILSSLDEALGRQFEKINRLTLAIKLSQLLGLDKVDEFISPELVKFEFNDRTYLNQARLKYQDFETLESFQQNPLIINCKLSLSAEYQEFFNINVSLAKLVVPWFNKVETELIHATSEELFVKSFEVLDICKQWKDSIPQAIKFNPITDLNQQFLLSTPIRRLILTHTLKYYELILQVLNYLLKFIFEMDIPSVLDAILRIVEICKELNFILEAQQVELVKQEFNPNIINNQPKILLNLQVYSELINSLQSCKYYITIINLNPNFNANSVKKFANLSLILNQNISNLFNNIQGLSEWWEGSELLVQKFNGNGENIGNQSNNTANGTTNQDNSIAFNPIMHLLKY